MLALHLFLYFVVSIMIVYSVRHYIFTISRVFGKQNNNYSEIICADWPGVTIFVMAHNEENVIGRLLTALVKLDYPQERLQIIPVNDRSTDHTRRIMDDFAHRYPALITPLHRFSGTPGKGAALKEATPLAKNDIIIIFDADYLPGRSFLKKIITPFFNPEVGAVMGRVVPVNSSFNMLTHLLDMERAGGYQVDQQARMNLHLVPQYGGTAGGIRKAALDEVGGWDDNSLTEDTELTYRLLLNGWKTVYQNNAECYEEVTEDNRVRKRQIFRWAKGHNQVFFRYAIPLLFSKNVNFWERIDGFLLLAIYMVPLLLLLGWIDAIALYYLGAIPNHYGLFGFLLIVSYISIGNFAPFFEIAAADYLDGRTKRLRLLPLMLFNFFSNLAITSIAPFSALADLVFKRKLVWDKTFHSGSSLNTQINQPETIAD